MPPSDEVNDLSDVSTAPVSLVINRSCTPEIVIAASKVMSATMSIHVYAEPDKPPIALDRLAKESTGT